MQYDNPAHEQWTVFDLGGMGGVHEIYARIGTLIVLENSLIAAQNAQDRAQRLAAEALFFTARDTFIEEGTDGQRDVKFRALHSLWMRHPVFRDDMMAPYRDSSI